VFRPAVAVEHHFDPNRLAYAELLKMARAHGRSRAYLFYHWEHGTITCPIAKRLWTVGKLFARRILSGTDRAHPVAWEVGYTMHLGFIRQYVIEQRRPRQYERQGLVKLNAHSR
jgi:hypothetical protein